MDSNYDIDNAPLSEGKPSNPDNKTKRTIVKVIGVGGWGGRIVHHLKQQSISGLETLAYDVHDVDLGRIDVDRKLSNVTVIREIWPEPWDPEWGRSDCLKVKEELMEFIKGTDILFIVAGMGRATGTGASPVIAGIARDLGILTIAIITMPFAGEGEERSRIAEEWLEMLGKIATLTW